MPGAFSSRDIGIPNAGREGVYVRAHGFASLNNFCPDVTVCNQMHPFPSGERNDAEEEACDYSL